jgi:hypothetical protein
LEEKLKSQNVIILGREGREAGESFSPKAVRAFFFIIVLLFICAYKAWVISLPCPHPLPYHPLHPFLLSPTSSIPSRNYFALISNSVEERV